ncbi:MAG TPA: hypothetical protein VIM11_26605 [Tepidisphaeraceae bacterium]|jgi:hypothetical protein
MKFWFWNWPKEKSLVVPDPDGRFVDYTNDPVINHPDLRRFYRPEDKFEGASPSSSTWLVPGTELSGK